jgi:hypothetical protein
MRTVSSIPVFARACGFSSSAEKGFRKHLNYLIRIKALEIQQGGFLGDNMHHHKIIVIHNANAINAYFRKKVKIAENAPEQSTDLPKSKERTERWERNESFDPRSIQLYVLKCTGREYYIRLPDAMITCLGIRPGDLLKLKLIEAWKHRELSEVRPVG